MTAELPPRLARMSRVPLRLLTWGLPMPPLVLLVTRGRRSGRQRVAPVALLRHDGREWLVAPFGETAWVLNARADAEATLRRGRRTRAVRLVEVDDVRKPEILLAYRRRFRLIPFVREAFGAHPREGVAAFGREGARHPVFRIEP
ncbi:nitroreductase family deazaflavin-dependent oxidoreductase [Virgisporangium aurantiacum]|uniref:Deazaflavin-dependent oxidoreductase, nitroreductase family n=1 Tax=Virgisporangium aurantiacum TaxID=175570 RepID=A0A8J4E3S7_9ACTN|nr:nitroreductase family deazaflavin-dependent oxidoreductase [Virgisporangium aurantiacum]GIJ60354.1 hypothetical protein Vau01_078700 [Virgisporangium aurantiacum]